MISLDDGEGARLAVPPAEPMVRRLAAGGSRIRSRLRFSSGVTFARLHIIPRLPLFLAAHPKLTVEAVLDDRDVDLIEEGIDVGFRRGMLADSAMVVRKIGKSRQLVLGTPAYSEKAGELLRQLSCQIIRL